MNRVSRREVLKLLAKATAVAGGLICEPQGIFALPADAAASALFERVSLAASGISWKHVSGRSPESYLPETTGAGCAFLDFDNDGWMDIYLVNSGKCDFYDPQPPLRNALYRNNRDGTFTDVTEKAGVAGGGYGMGIAVGDYDSDGWPDMYVTQYGRSILYRNNGNGTFTDVTEKSGVAAPGWATSAVWFDYDNDGKLDLFVCNFVEFSKGTNKFCGSEQYEHYYCVPRVYPPSRSWLFHNNGDGTFTDVSKEAGIGQMLSKAWGVVATDVNNDGWMDLFVSNDTLANALFINNHKGGFNEVGLDSGVAYSADGRVRSGMGVDSADYDEDGWQDLFVTNVDQEMYSVYNNNHDETFDDVAESTGMARVTRQMSGWGIKSFDYDNDGKLDLFIANGHPDDHIEKHSNGVSYKEPLLLFHNNGHGLEDVSANAGSVFSERFAARGMAVGDFNNDGAIDVLIAINNGAPLLLKNVAARGNHWLGLKLVGKKANRDAIGARIVWHVEGVKRSRLKVGGGSYLSSHDPRMVIGLGKMEKLDRLEIHWPLPSEHVDVLTDLPMDRYITVVEGAGIQSR